MKKFYQKVKEDLLSLGDEKYLCFQKKLNATNKDMKQIGIRIPILRKYAKNLKKDYQLNFLIDNIDEEYYEEILLKGFLIGLYQNLSFDEISQYINLFVPKIKDWGICDSFCCSLKITKKYHKEMLEVIKKYLKSTEEFEVRFALVMLLNYYLIDEYIDDVFFLIEQVHLDKYYVNMALAWLISYCFIKYYDKTYCFVKDNTFLNDFTYRMAIQKTIDSFQLSKDLKEQLKKLKV